MEKYLAEYLRLSIEDGDVALDDEKKESNSISHQRDLIREYRKEHGMSELKSREFVDDGYSGTNFNRPAMKELLEMVKQGKVSCIIVKDISRFGRNYLEVGDYLEQVLPFMGVRFISVNDQYDSNDYIGTTGGIEVAFKSILYDMYSKDLSVKMRSVLEIRRKHGDCMSPVPPFGYLHSAESRKKLEVDPVASKHICRVFQLACLGYTTGTIARMLNDENIPTPAMYKNMTSEKRKYHIRDHVGYWNAKMVKGIIENKVYIGCIVNKKREVLTVGGKKYVDVPEDERICVSNMHEAIVTEEQFKDANKVIRRRGKEPAKRKRVRSDSVLLGKLFCGECGRRLIRISCTTVPYFKCEKTDFDRQCSCPRMRLGEPEIEAVIKKCILKETEKIGDWNHEFSATRLDDDLNKQIQKLEQEADTIRLHKQYLHEKLKMGYLDQEKYLGKVKTLRQKEERNTKLMEECRKSKKEIGEKIDILENTKNLQHITREIVDALIEKIVVYDIDRIEIVWRFKFIGK
ncbi:MAG: recombinase family protein [Hespellia sp.]|nr:recombinase family protein [Hespellia sp.]